jgi:phenylalanyl-tRNA synthetase beta chain
MSPLCGEDIEEVKIGPSPQWMKNRLEKVGIRSISNVVDVTNYVMMEYGQPLHAFDFELLEEGRIVVRRARQGEEFVTLDGVKRALDEEMLMICDGVKPVAIAGIMGGLNSEIKENTKRVLLESAYFNPRGIGGPQRSLVWKQKQPTVLEEGSIMVDASLQRTGPPN